jgi:hypothetical protein
VCFSTAAVGASPGGSGGVASSSLQRRVKVEKHTIRYKLTFCASCSLYVLQRDSQCSATFVVKQVNVNDDDPSPRNKMNSKNFVSPMASEIKIVA